MFKFDCYLLYYPVGSHIDTHTDPVPNGYEHHRLNVVLKECEVGGYFYKYEPQNLTWESVAKVVKFRPDIEPHGVTEVQNGSRWVLSIGWLRRKNEAKN